MRDVLFTPWRMEYILSDKSGPCLFCEKLNENKDEENLILFRGDRSFVIMNLYPYNNGHLMIVSNKHSSTLHDLDDATRSEMMKLVTSSEIIINKVMSPDGFNIGINIGEVAGAGIRDHIHIHIVPRWKSDTNFFTTLAESRAVPESLKETYIKLSSHFNELKSNCSLTLPGYKTYAKKNQHSKLQIGYCHHLLSHYRHSRFIQADGSEKSQKTGFHR